MATVPGVLGPIDTAELGFTLMHEHVLVANWAMRHAFPDWIDREAHVRKATAEVLAAKARGVGTIVDLTPINLGRDISIIREVAERAQMQIIAATGLYWAEEPWLAAWPADALVDWLLRDLLEGIEGSDVRAGIIKCATYQAETFFYFLTEENDGAQSHNDDQHEHDGVFGGCRSLFFY